LRQHHERVRVALNEERGDHGMTNLAIVIGAVDRREKLRGPRASEESEVADGGEAKLVIFFAACDLAELVGVAAEEHRLDDALANGSGSLGVVQVGELVLRADESELTDSIRAKLVVLLRLRDLEQPALVAGDHERLENRLLELEVVRRRIDVAEGLARVLAAGDAEVFDGGGAELGIGAVARGAAEDIH